jgi:hypothetical protein
MARFLHGKKSQILVDQCFDSHRRWLAKNGHFLTNFDPCHFFSAETLARFYASLDADPFTATPSGHYKIPHKIIINNFPKIILIDHKILNIIKAPQQKKDSLSMYTRISDLNTRDPNRLTYVGKLDSHTLQTPEQFHAFYLKEVWEKHVYPMYYGRPEWAVLFGLCPSLYASLPNPHPHPQPIPKPIAFRDLFPLHPT